MENTLCSPSEDSFDDTEWRKGALGKFIMKHANNDTQLMQVYPFLCFFSICRNKVYNINSRDQYMYVTMMVTCKSQNDRGQNINLVFYLLVFIPRRIRNDSLLEFSTILDHSNSTIG